MYIPTKPISAYPWYIRLFFFKQKKTYGKVLEPGMLWARSPKIFMGVALLYGALNRKSSPLSPSLRSLVTVRVSQINHCEFCIDINATTLLKRGVSEAKTAQLNNWQNSDEFSEIERIALEYTESITYSDKEVTSEQITELKKYFTDDELVELTGMIAFQNMSSKFNSALDIPSQGFCKIPLKELQND